MMAASYCNAVRPPPPAYSPPLPFTTYFRDRTQVQTFFAEGFGQVTTAGSLACRRTDHLNYNVSFAGYGLDDSAQQQQQQQQQQDLRGLRIVMDDVNGASCHRQSQIATGHLLTKTYLPASGGRIEMRARIGFGADPASQYRSADSFSCLGLYVHQSVSEHGYRNEISMCVSSADTKTMRLGYWVGDDGDKQHAKQVTLSIDLAQSFNLYSIEWSPHRIQFAVNDAAIWTIDGQSLCAGARAAEVDADKSTPKRLPFEPMSVRVILRPRGREYLPPPTHMDVASFNFKPAVLADSVPAEPVVVERASLSSSGGRKSRPSLLALALGCVLVMHMVS